MSDDIVVVGSVKKSPIGSPPLKKLKQSRLPFAPINTKSPKQNETSSSEKKRKLSGSDGSSSTPKTPRSESKEASTPIADENKLMRKAEESAAKDESPEEKKGTEEVGKKRGRSSGAKNKPNDGSLASPQGDNSPVVKKRGRPSGGGKSSSGLNKSVDLDKSSQGEKEKPAAIEKKSEVKRSGNEESDAEQHSEESTSCGKPGETTSRKASQDGGSKNDEESSPCGSGDDGNAKSSTDVKSAKSVEDGKNEVSAKKRGRSKKSLTPPEKDTPKRKRGRPSGAKNIRRDSSQTSLNRSVCSNPSDDESNTSLGNTPVASKKEKPIEKTRKLLAIFASPGAGFSSKKEGKKVKDTGTPSESKEKKGKCESAGKNSKSENADKEDSVCEIKGAENPSQQGTKKDIFSFAKEKNKDVDGKESGIKKDSSKKTEDEISDKESKKTANKDSGKSQGQKENINKKNENVSKKSENVDKKSENVDKKSENVDKKNENVDKKNENVNKKSENVDKKNANKKSDIVDKKSDTVDKKNATVNKKSDTVDKKSDTVDKKSDTVDKKSDTVDKKSENVDKKSENVDKKNENVNKKSENVDKKNTNVNKKSDIVDKKSETVDKKSENISKKNEKGSKDVEVSEVDPEVEENSKKEKTVNEVKSSSKDEKAKEKDDLAKEKLEEENSDDESETKEADESKDLDESVNGLDVSTCESEESANKTLSPGSASDAGKSPASGLITPTSAGPKSRFFTKSKRLTPLQKEREAAKLLKMEERTKQKEDKEKQLKEKEIQRKQKEEEKQKQKEEREKAKEELKKKRQDEIDAKKQKKEEEIQKKEEERLKREEEKQKREEEKQKKEEEKQKKEEERQKKEEERQKKEEERVKRAEEQQKKEEEKRKQSDKLKNKFVSFFVPKKKEAEDETKDCEGPFKDFRVKEDMLLAPIVRQRLSECQVTELDEYVSGGQKDSSRTYLKDLKSENFVRRKSKRTFPCIKKPKVDDDDDDVMVVDEDDDMGDYSAMIQDPASNMVEVKKHKAKLLLFCENRRPAYWGTWMKNSDVVSARRPFAREEIFDYEYDSDDDWEEEEAGESLSDSEGEDKDDKEEEGDQYEVDNDFFVPHGYLSDDEGKSDQEDDEDAAQDKSKDTDRNRNTEQLKLKQAEFEEEMKKKTKQLKPRLIGCLWMADENNNQAYGQLMKILGPHRAVTLCPQLPIGGRNRHRIPKESNKTDVEDDSAADYRTGNSKKFVKAFPEEAVPALIKLLHGNRHGKAKLCREFGDYWRKLTRGDLEESVINSTPIKTPVSGSVHISKRKVEAKIQEVGVWKRCLDESTNRHVMCWFVTKKVREDYGLMDLGISNSWIYINRIYINNPVKEKKEERESEEDTPKINKMRPITAFTKKIPSTPSSTNTSPNSTPSNTPLHNQLSKADSSLSLSAASADTPNRTPSSNKKATSSLATPETPAGKQPASGKQNRKKVNLFPVKSKETKGQPPKGSIVSFFKKSKGNSPHSPKMKAGVSSKGSSSSLEEQIITLE